MRISRRIMVALGAVGLALTATACTPTISLKPAPNANSLGCADLMTSNLPNPLAGQNRVWTDAQATAAWGNPTAIILTCGVSEPKASPLPCQSIGGIDWLVDETQSKEGYLRFTSFGRSPAVQVFVDTTRYVDGGEVLKRVTKSMRDFKLTGRCSDRPTT